MASQQTLSFSSQDEPDYTILPSVPAPAEVSWQQRRWARIDHAVNRRKGATVSRIWQLGNKYIALNDPNLHAWRCQLCSGNSLISLPRNRIGTGPAVRHIRKKHRMALEDNDGSDVASITSIGTNDSNPSSIVSSLIQRVNVDRFRYHLLR